MEVNIEDTYMLRDSGVIVVTFESLKDRDDVFFNKKKLRDYENADGKGIFFNELLPPELNDKKNREWSIM